MVMSPMSVNQQHVLNKVSLNRNTQTQVYVWLFDKNVTTASQEPNPVFPLGLMLHYSLIQLITANWL